MPMPTYKEWIDGTAKTFHSRGDKLKELDAALAIYLGKDNVAGVKTTKTLLTVITKLDEWKNYNQARDWTQSIRERKGMVTQLETALNEVRSKTGLVSAIGGGVNVPKNLGALLASNAKQRESAFDQNIRSCVVPTHQKQVYPVGAYPSEVPAGSGNWVGNTAPKTVDFNWDSKFDLVLRRKTLEVIVRIKPKVANVVVGGKFQQTWKTHIQSTWKGASFRSGDETYSVEFNLQFVDESYPGDSFTVEVASVPPPPIPVNWRAAEQQRSRAVVGGDVGTPHMGQWGGTDAAVISHEFGHMLGLPDEYYTTEWNNTALNGAMYNQVPFTTNSIMNNTGKEGRIFPRHFETVKRQFEIWQGLQAHSVEVILVG